ncbi:MAG: hypothetical protein GTO02_05755, partial [Candidatus Dadabacteria bacterium]|nr:hypothetical protein [Candidatus Dadabacteria bacterium]
MNELLEDFKLKGYDYEVIGKFESAILVTKLNDKDRELKDVFVSYETFYNIVTSDPTKQKIFIQWMLNTFSKLLKNGEIREAERFVEEDLPQAKQYLELFEANKRKKLFRELCNSNERRKAENINLTDDEWLNKKYNCADINQYKDLGCLFDAVYPFMERDTSALEKLMQSFVNMGQALIPIKDRKFTVYIPKTTEANCVFHSFTGWCTAKKGNGMFKNYTNYKTPSGNKSNIYIIVNNKVFENESDEMYQIHFQSNQIKDKSNGPNKKLYEAVMSKSEAVANYFREELMIMAKEWSDTHESNPY